MVPRTVARSIATMMLIAAALAVFDVFREIAISPDISIVSLLLLILYFGPLILTVVGAASLFTGRKFGYLFIYIGYVVSIFDFYWLYIPFVPLPMEPLYLVVAEMLGVNGVIVGILVWCQFREIRRFRARNPV